MTRMDELLAWLRRVLDEDEQTLRGAASDVEAPVMGSLGGWLLADIEAKRAILAEHTAAVGPACPTCAVYIGGSDVAPVKAPCRTVRLLASAYRARPGIREEWRP